jgi:MoxR-like ATPase
MINCDVCLLHEADRMDEICWVCLVPLIDYRRYVESAIAGVKIKADPEFQIFFTMNNDTSITNLPDYILSRSNPFITIKLPKIILS